jgi:hypothetical protein
MKQIRPHASELMVVTTAELGRYGDRTAASITPATGAWRRHESSVAKRMRTAAP